MKTITRSRRLRIEPGPPTPVPPDPTPDEPIPPLPDPMPRPEPDPDRASMLLRLAELPRAVRERALAQSRRGATMGGGIVRLPGTVPRAPSFH